MIDDKNRGDNRQNENFRPLIPTYPDYVERAEWRAAQAVSEEAYRVQDEAYRYQEMFYNYGPRFGLPVEPIIVNTRAIEKAILDIEVFRADILAKLDVIAAELEILMDRSKEPGKDD